MLRQTSLRTNTQHGAALLLFALVLISVLLGGFLSRLNSATQERQRDRIASESLARAKEALIGFAISYRDTHPEQVFGYLPCPDTDNDGEVGPDCGISGVSVIGRLPWKELGLPAPRDASGECLWYAVSGHFKNNPKTVPLNWDSLSQFIVEDPDGTTLAGGNAHERPVAVIFAPRAALAAQARAPAGVSECGGNNNPAAYLEGVGALGAGDTTITLSNADSIRNGTNNDQGLWITGKEIFDRIVRRSDFKTDIDTLVDGVANHLNNQNPADLPNTSPDRKGVKVVIDKYLEDNPALSNQKENVLTNWQDNLLYVGGPGGNFTLTGSTTPCRALLFFGGNRTTRTLAPLTAQTRSTAAEKGDDANFGDATMYLEGDNALLFPANGTYTRATQFSAENPDTDLVRCINGLGSGSASFSNATDFASFTPTGVGVKADATTDPATPTVSMVDASGSSGGCFWFPTAIPLAGKTLRAYYDFRFIYADTYALDGLGSDRGNGFTFQMLRSDLGLPSTCGSETTMGALKTSDMWGSLSFIVETDIHKDGSVNDPVGNHTAVHTNGSLSHASGTMSAACNGTLSGCRREPSNGFEESLKPLSHNQRIEIHSGCNAGCSSCNPLAHAAPNTYARISVWIDCTDCNDVVADLNRLTKAPSIQRCTALHPELNAIYFGFTGGFRSGSTAGEAPAQGVTISNFSLRSD